MKILKILFLPVLAANLLTGCGDSHPKKPVSKWAAAGTVSLQDAAFNGNVEAINQHIANGSDLNAKDPKTGSTPLISAAVAGQTQAAKALITGGANLNLQNNDGSTALMCAAFFGHADLVRALLQAGADKNLRNKFGSTALESVQVPFESVQGIYDYLGTVLAPAGLKLDYAQIKAERPRIARLLQ
ncbi:MAG: ankyrin repeat domain-containing protein [Verrucomicrobiota bacterium]